MIDFKRSMLPMIIFCSEITEEELIFVKKTALKLIAPLERYTSSF